MQLTSFRNRSQHVTKKCCSELHSDPFSVFQDGLGRRLPYASPSKMQLKYPSFQLLLCMMMTCETGPILKFSAGHQGSMHHLVWLQASLCFALGYNLIQLTLHPEFAGDGWHLEAI